MIYLLLEEIWLFNFLWVRKMVKRLKYEYEVSGYGIEFDACLRFLLSNWEWDKNVIFGVESNSVPANNKKKIS